jgi:hypothetical protein
MGKHALVVNFPSILGVLVSGRQPKLPKRGNKSEYFESLLGDGGYCQNKVREPKLL